MLRRAGFALLLAILVASTPAAWGNPARHRAVINGDALRTGEVIDRRSNAQAGAHASEIISLKLKRFERRAIFKPSGGETATLLARLSGIAAGTHALREVATSNLAQHLRLPFVPHTIGREIDGLHGSVQLFVPDAVRSTDAWQPGRALVRHDAERLRVFDYLIGNSDRTVRNLMVRRRGGDHLPVAIDNGNAFPRGPIPQFQWPTAWVLPHRGPLLVQTRRFIAGIDASAVARVLAASGIEPDAAVHALRRLVRLKRDPSFLEVPRRGSKRAIGIQMYLRASLAGRSHTQGLRWADRARIDVIVADAYRAVQPPPVTARQPLLTN
jgi:hypothetical protein